MHISQIWRNDETVFQMAPPSLQKSFFGINLSLFAVTNFTFFYIKLFINKEMRKIEAFFGL